MYYLSIDIGTTGGKVLLFDEKLNLLRDYRADYLTYHNDTDHQAEHDPEDWWRVAVDGVRKVTADVNVHQIAGIGLSCMTPVLLPVDEAGNPLTRAWIWSDRRGEIMLPELFEKISAQRIIEICGSSAKPISFIVKLLYYNKHFPKLYEKTDAFLQANGYLIRRMTGVSCVDRSHVSLMHLVDKDTLEYSDEVFSKLDLDRSKFPELVEMGCNIGMLTETAGEELGLPAGIPVIPGGHDSALSAYSFSLDEPGKACLDIGNAANLVMGAASAVNCPAADVYVYPERGKWLFQIYCATCGASFRWFRNVFAASLIKTAEEKGVSEYDLLCEEAAISPPGAKGMLFFPNLQGSQHCAHVSGRWEGIGLQHNRADFIRSLLEGNAMSVRYNKEAMEQASGLLTNHLKVCGGGAKSRFWLQIFADVLNCTVEVNQVSEAAGTGAAMLVQRVVKGKMERCESCKQKMIITPNPENVKTYERVYAAYKKNFEAQISECMQRE